MRTLATTALLLLGLAATPAVAQISSGPAPDFGAQWTLPEQGAHLDGTRTLADLRGRVVLIEFWRTW